MGTTTYRKTEEDEKLLAKAQKLLKPTHGEVKQAQVIRMGLRALVEKLESQKEK